MVLARGTTTISTEAAKGRRASRSAASGESAETFYVPTLSAAPTRRSSRPTTSVTLTTMAHLLRFDSPVDRLPGRSELTLHHAARKSPPGPVQDRARVRNDGGPVYADAACLRRAARGSVPHACRSDEPDPDHDNKRICPLPYSCVVDSQLPMSEEALVKVFGWYDNRWGNGCRLVDRLASAA